MKDWFPKPVLLCLLMIVFVLGFSGAAARPATASMGAPTVVSYQGQVRVGGSVYSGVGHFKFAVVDSGGTISYWSNDGTSSGGSEPTASVSLSVSGGLFSVLLGDISLTGMTSPLTDAVFATSTDTYLRVWFSDDGVSFSRLTPDQKIAAVPYALQAESAKDAESLDGLDSTAFTQALSGTCPRGEVIAYIAPDGSVFCEPYSPFPLHAMLDQGMVGFGFDVAIGPEGLPLILFYNGDQIRSIACRDAACTAITDHTFIPTPGAAYVGEISMAFGTDGLAAFTVWDSTSSLPFFGHCDDPACSTLTLVPLPFPGTGQVEMDLTMTVDGNPLIVGVDSTGLVVPIYCLDMVCSTPFLQPPLSFTALGKPSVTMMGDGLPMFAVQDRITGNLATVICADPFCGVFGPTALHAGTTPAFAPEITTGQDGFGIVAYIDAGASPAVRFVKCTNASCGAITNNLIFTIVLPPVTMPKISLTRGSDGLPLIGFYDHTPALEGFWMAHCTDIACTNATTNQLHLGLGDGERSALTVGMDGMPFGVFTLSASMTEMTFHCSNHFCTPFWRGW